MKRRLDASPTPPNSKPSDNVETSTSSRQQEEITGQGSPREQVEQSHITRGHSVRQGQDIRSSPSGYYHAFHIGGTQTSSSISQQSIRQSEELSSVPNRTNYEPHYRSTLSSHRQEEDYPPTTTMSNEYHPVQETRGRQHHQEPDDYLNPEEVFPQRVNSPTTRDSNPVASTSPHEPWSRNASPLDFPPPIQSPPPRTTTSRHPQQYALDSSTERQPPTPQRHTMGGSEYYASPYAQPPPPPPPSFQNQQHANYTGAHSYSEPQEHLPVQTSSAYEYYPSHYPPPPVQHPYYQQQHPGYYYPAHQDSQLYPNAAGSYHNYPYDQYPDNPTSLFRDVLPRSSSPQSLQSDTSFIKTINNNDVLCGRGGATNSHAGNRAFRLLVKDYKDKYLKAKKKEKPEVAAIVVGLIRKLDPPGRFLRKDRETGYWVDIGDTRAKEKTSQALREGAPLRRKNKTSSDADDDGTSGSDTVPSPEKSITSGPVHQEEVSQSEKKSTMTTDTPSAKEQSPGTVKSTEKIDAEEKPKAGPKTTGESENDGDGDGSDSGYSGDSSRSSSEKAKGGSKSDESRDDGSPDNTTRKRRNSRQETITNPTNEPAEPSPVTLTKRLMTRVDMRDLSEGEKVLYNESFAPPRAPLRRESQGSKEEEDKVILSSPEENNC